MSPRGLSLFVFIVGITGAVQAQPSSADRSEQPGAQAVRATIDALFDGMRAGDSAAVRDLFAAGARIRSVQAQGARTVVDTETPEAFAQAVGQPHEAVWDERVWNVDIYTDGPMAAAWMPYVFYLGTHRSHCGVNSFHLVRRESEWRIQHITFTRREECAVPSEVKKSAPGSPSQ